MLLILVILLGGFIGIFFALRQKPKPVYLKPKNKSKNNGEKKDESESSTPTPDKTEHQAKSDANIATGQNNDVLKSEVKTLRQSAVSMSVGQKEAATKIIQDWLDEPSEENNNQDESEKEEQD